MVRANDIAEFIAVPLLFGIGMTCTFHILPFIYDYKVDHEGVRIVAFRCITLWMLPVDKIDAVRLVDLGATPLMTLQAFTWLSLGNRPRLKFVTIKMKRGLLTIALTPPAPADFVATLQLQMEGRSAL